jgi:hypothetical protein
MKTHEELICRDTEGKNKNFRTVDTFNKLVVGTNDEWVRTKSGNTQSVIVDEVIGVTKSREGVDDCMKSYSTASKPPRPSVPRRYRAEGPSRWITKAMEVKDSRSESSTVSQERSAVLNGSSDASSQRRAQPRTSVPRRYRDGRRSERMMIIAEPSEKERKPHASETIETSMTLKEDNQQIKQANNEDEVLVQECQELHVGWDTATGDNNSLPVIQERVERRRISKIYELRKTTTQMAKVTQDKLLGMKDCVERSFIESIEFFAGSYSSSSEEEDSESSD